jgi:hypothetical protein
MNQKQSYLSAIAGCALSVVACASAPDTNTGAKQRHIPVVSDGDGVAAQPLTDTSISVNADGTTDTFVRTVTAEYRAIESKYKDKHLVAKLQSELLYKDQQGLASQVSCDDPDAIWLNTDYEQGGNRICYNGFGTATSDTIASGYANNIKSWWAGAESGALHDNNHPPGHTCDWAYLCGFNDWEREDYADFRVDDTTACSFNWQCPSGWCLSGFCSCASNASCPSPNDTCVEGWCYNGNCGPRANQVNLSANCIE